MIHPSVIFIGGVTGSGKSSIGWELSHQLHCEFFDGDDFHTEENKAKMGRGEPLNDDDRMPWLEKLAVLWQRELACSKRVVIACSALKKKYRDILLGGDNSPNGIINNVVIFMLKVPREIIKSRVANRKDHFAKEDLIDSQLDTLELPEDEPNIIVIDGTLPIEQVVNEIIHRLNFISIR